MDVESVYSLPTLTQGRKLSPAFISDEIPKNPAAAAASKQSMSLCTLLYGARKKAKDARKEGENLMINSVRTSRSAESWCLESSFPSLQFRAATSEAIFSPPPIRPLPRLRRPRRCRKRRGPGRIGGGFV